MGQPGRFVRGVGSSGGGALTEEVELLNFFVFAVILVRVVAGSTGEGWVKLRVIAVEQRRGEAGEDQCEMARALAEAQKDGKKTWRHGVR